MGGFFIRCAVGGFGLGTMFGGMAVHNPVSPIVGAILVVGALISNSLASR